MTVSKEAIEAAALAWFGASVSAPLPSKHDLARMEIALTAALPFLARTAPSQSDEEMAHGIGCWWYLTGKERLQILDALSAVRAEATLAGAAAEREACAKVADDSPLCGSHIVAGAIRARKP